MSSEETSNVAEFLLRSQNPKENRTSGEPPTEKTAAIESVASTSVLCSACNSDRLTAYWGEKAYMWKCQCCDERAPIPVVCSVCGAVGSQGKTVRISKRGAWYYRCCESCEIEECVWIER